MIDNGKSRYWAFGIGAAAILSLVVASTHIVQPAYGHALITSNTVNVDGAGKREITIVLGHTNEPTFGAKTGIHDGKHGVEVFLEDGATALPLTGASLKVDKYYFKDIDAFKKAKSVKDATDTEKGVTLGGVFGDPGHYVSRQVQKDGIYGYRLFGTIDYFQVASLKVDTTVFCVTDEGDTSKFNSKGWFGGFGCTEEIDDILFPERNSEVKSVDDIALNVASATDSGAVQQVTLPIEGSASPMATAAVNTAPSAAGSLSILQMAAMIGIPVAAAGSFVGIKSIRQSRSDSSL